MHTVMMWVLLSLSPFPQQLGTFVGPNAHTECVEAKYNYTAFSHDAHKPTLICRPQTQRVGAAMDSD